ncbi:putative ATPase, AAA family domain containing protein [Neospora caninum Liverpool]|uniref:ATPase, AAA family domain containing protein,putative n=1 Tax=Neospora caninum (strain Liverpool) TaxID=572307 RepID=F0VRA1_NEOCL|nr:putative ATPase, AAA family domain containing protein [Neospora caninum Liverpool]CBZ56249.1 putative ATPase, AAA family domain containing protein [Neospora caninum Liverpool]CEL71011.1 TPA: ATPase, AAA family domain containing protein,putative [Neospora caninum Liverpool]|eukprot:XP_003886274.1 putative ATPase, AAA family domain containing protein [Neospora caninum Liverpool]
MEGALGESIRRETIVIDSDEDGDGEDREMRKEGLGEIDEINAACMRKGGGNPQSEACLEDSWRETRDGAEEQDETFQLEEDDLRLFSEEQQIEWLEEESARETPRVFFMWNSQEKCFQQISHPTEQHLSQASYASRLSQQPNSLLPSSTSVSSSSSSTLSSSSVSSPSLVLGVPSSGARIRGLPAWFCVPLEHRSKEAVNALWRDVLRHTQVYNSLQNGGAPRRLPAGSSGTSPSTAEPPCSPAACLPAAPSAGLATASADSEDMQLRYPPWLYLSRGTLPSPAHASDVWQEIRRDVAAFLKKGETRRRSAGATENPRGPLDAKAASPGTGKCASFPESSLPSSEGDRGYELSGQEGDRRQGADSGTKGECFPGKEARDEAAGLCHLPAAASASLAKGPSVKRETRNQASFVANLLRHASGKTSLRPNAPPNPSQPASGRLAFRPASSSASFSRALMPTARPRDGDAGEDRGAGLAFPPKKKFASLASAESKPSVPGLAGSSRGSQAAPYPRFSVASLAAKAVLKKPPQREGEQALRCSQSGTHGTDEKARERGESSPFTGDSAGSGDARRRDTQVYVPLAERLRPTSLDEFVGQTESIQGGRGSVRELMEAGHIPSLILWGPPGCGKTTLALLAGRCTNRKSPLSLPPVFKKMSAVTCGVNDVRKVVQEALTLRATTKQKTILFLDEIHRFNKAQQDALLPHVESGTVTLIGATTENPSFEVNRALLSRCRVCKLEPLTEDNLTVILQRAAKEENVTVTEAAVRVLCRLADGDARRALNMLENAIHHERSEVKTKDASKQQREACPQPLHSSSPPPSASPPSPSPSQAPPGCLSSREDGVCRERQETVVDVSSLESVATKSHLIYDKNRDCYYDLISALHKSVRGSDEHAAVYYLTRMLEAGEDPLKIARRIVRMASEDIGLADPSALPLCVAAYQASHFTGMPECSTALAMAVIYLCKCPKSNAVDLAYSKAKSLIQEHPDAPVPLHLRNAPTKLMAQLGYGRGYVHTNQPAATLPQFQSADYRAQTYLPEALLGTKIVPNIGRPASRGGWCPQ